MDFGRHAGMENRAKSEKKRLKKRIEKHDEKKLRFGSPWVGGFDGRAMEGRVSGTPLIVKIKDPTPQPTDLKNT